MNGFPRALRALVLSLTGAVLLSSCSFSIYDMPLPGGTDVGGDPIQVKAEFADVLDLVPKTTVKINDVSVGKITEIDLDGETAVVTMLLPQGVELPDNAVAEIRQTSLLGEKFVSLNPPETGASTNPLGDGDVIPLEDTGRNPEVEEVLGALSLLLNGGGVAQMKTIATELNLALEGREDSAKSVFRQIRTLMSQLDANKGDIIAAIEGLNRLSISVNDQMGAIDAALTELPSALQTLDRQRNDLVRMLKSISRLSGVGVRVIQASKQATIESFRQLVPVLSQLSEAGDAFVNAFHVFLTYPFIDEVVGRDPQVARNLHMGDYTNLSVQMDLKVSGSGENDDGPVPPVETACTTIGDVREELGNEIPLDELLEYLEGLDDLCDGAQDVIDQCLAKDTVNKVAQCLENKLQVTIAKITQGALDNTCEILGIPAKDCPQLPDGGGGGGGGGGDPLPDIPIPDLPRAAFGPDPAAVTGSGPTVGELMETYDPALVSLLVPGMVTR